MGRKSRWKRIRREVWEDAYVYPVGQDPRPPCKTRAEKRAYPLQLLINEKRIEKENTERLEQWLSVLQRYPHNEPNFADQIQTIFR